MLGVELVQASIGNKLAKGICLARKARDREVFI